MKIREVFCKKSPKVSNYIKVSFTTSWYTCAIISAGFPFFWFDTAQTPLQKNMPWTLLIHFSAAWTALHCKPFFRFVWGCRRSCHIWNLSPPGKTCCASPHKPTNLEERGKSFGGNRKLFWFITEKRTSAPPSSWSWGPLREAAKKEFFFFLPAILRRIKKRRKKILWPLSR